MEELFGYAVHRIAGLVSGPERAWYNQHRRDDGNADEQLILLQVDDTIQDFQELVIKFGYIALFAPAFPLAPLMALLRNVYELRSKARRYCTDLRRPEHNQRSDIGSWKTILKFLGLAAVIVNASMVTMVGQHSAVLVQRWWLLAETDGDQGLGDGVQHRMLSARLWILTLILEHGILLLRYFSWLLVPTNPQWIENATELLEYRKENLVDVISSMQRKSGATDLRRVRQRGANKLQMWAAADNEAQAAIDERPKRFKKVASVVKVAALLDPHLVTGLNVKASMMHNAGVEHTTSGKGTHIDRRQSTSSIRVR